MSTLKLKKYGKKDINNQTNCISSDSMFANNVSLGIAQKITISDIRSIEIYNEISDNEALEIIESIYKLSIITYKIYKNE